jgi:Uma2 family endonuclease
MVFACSIRRRWFGILKNREASGDNGEEVIMNRASTLDIIYPESDGKPMAESDLHRDWMFRIIELLKLFFAGQRVYVSGNLLIYYIEGNPKKSVAPDAFVVKNCDPRRRRIYKLWEEGKPPNFVLETTSSSTRREDQLKKMRLYAQLGVAEYFLYDPLGDWLEPPLLGYRLVRGKYLRIEVDKSGGGLTSEQLGITFRLEEGQLAVFDASTGMRLLTGAERAVEAEARAKALEQELARIQAERGNS